MDCGLTGWAECAQPRAPRTLRSRGANKRRMSWQYASQGHAVPKDSKHLPALSSSRNAASISNQVCNTAIAPAPSHCAIPSRSQETTSLQSIRGKQAQTTGKAPKRPNRPLSQGSAAAALRRCQTLTRETALVRSYPHGAPHSWLLGLTPRQLAPPAPQHPVGRTGRFSTAHRVSMPGHGDPSTAYGPKRAGERSGG